MPNFEMGLLLNGSGSTQDPSLLAGKADKVSGAASGDFAGLDSNGNLTDSGKKATDFANRVQNATNDHVASLDASGNLKDSGISRDDVATRGMISNRNLLDNPWFTVNQRGTGTFTGVGYCSDRWKIQTSGLNVSVSSGGISATGPSSGSSTVAQFFEVPLSPGTYTISANVNSCSGTSCQVQLRGENDNYFLLNISSGATGIVSQTVYVTENIPRLQIRMPNNGSVSLRALKVEPGSVSTLAMDAHPDYADELRKCRRYFCRISGGGLTSYFMAGTGVCHSATSARLMIPVQMYPKAPAITYSGSFEILTNGGSRAVSAMSSLGYSSAGIGIDCTSSSMITGQAAVLRSSNDANAYIDISCEL